MGHYKGGPHMESAKQERKNLLDINPIAKHASGGSWMSKHSKSALHMGHSPAEMGHSPAEMGHESPAEMHGGFHVGDAAKSIAGGVIKAAKKVKAAGSKIAKAVSADLFEGGSERKRKLRAARGGAKPAKIFKK
jgi:hypothetical protein